jgi:DNA-directed RNA polymerase subunit RPC12/RpoP
VTLTKRCTKCWKELSLDQFSSHSVHKDKKNYRCKRCDSERKRIQREIGGEIRFSTIRDAGGCQNPDCCSANYGKALLLHDENYLSFQLDHIDESLKLNDYETDAQWIAGHQDDFFQRVKPNIQVLCYQCHLLKTKRGRVRGNSIDQKMYGRKLPAQFIDPGYNLFNDVERFDIFVDDDGEIWETPIYSKGFYEDGWFVQRDLDGFLISYLELQDGEGKYFMYNKDGERIL